jgi:hypothetical protein
MIEERNRFSLSEDRELLKDLLSSVGETDLLACHEIKPAVYRLKCGSAGHVRSFVAKRLKPEAASRNKLAAMRWLPQVTLAKSGPPLLGLTADRKGEYTWHLYEDLGNCAVDENNPGIDQLQAVVRTVAQMHARFANHPLLAECRLYGVDLGIRFYSSNVRDAIRCLEALSLRRDEFCSERQALLGRLLCTLYQFLDEEPYRAQVMSESGGPETLLHGDLWPSNTLVFEASNQLQVRLIDWDRAGTGPISYDLSSFLHRLPHRYRQKTLQYYRDYMRTEGWQLPAGEVLNVLFDTAERSRLVSRIVWGAIAALDGLVDWGFDEMEAFEGWLGALEPILSGE